MGIDDLGTASLLKACDDLEDLVFIKDREGRVLFANAAARAVAGFPPDELIGKKDREVFPDPPMYDEVKRVERQIMQSGVSRTVEVPIVVEGEPRTYISIKGPLRRADEIIGLVALATDITARKRLERELLERDARLAEAQTVGLGLTPRGVQYPLGSFGSVSRGPAIRSASELA